ncbi:hypothetical protein chiPu_0005449 [Chiloscyllium punctatum]|uniref:Uncharacterized protein n=1 Tax=Chiloscyllium punctatum TaxID=137246 RepID=A0A401S9F4_CHIPU|nr:hypothetical protein [Chiloscyllium punctatum]
MCPTLPQFPAQKYSPGLAVPIAGTQDRGLRQKGLLGAKSAVHAFPSPRQRQGLDYTQMPNNPNHPNTEQSTSNSNRYHQQEVNHSDRSAASGSLPGQGSALISVKWRRARQAPRDPSEVTEPQLAATAAMRKPLSASSSNTVLTPRAVQPPRLTVLCRRAGSAHYVTSQTTNAGFSS